MKVLLTFFTTICLTAGLSAQSWNLKGTNIDGEAANDESGKSISMPDRNTIAIGADKNDGNGNNSGHVRIYHWDGNAWVQKGTDINGEAADDQSGYSVSMPDNNTLAIGAYNNDGGGSNAGHVRIYRWNGSAWVQKGADIDGEAIADVFGWSVSMPDSNTVAAGAPANDGGGSSSGHARVFNWNGSAWVQKGADIDGEAAFDEAGFSVSMADNNTIAIGARFNDGNGNNAGHVRIYRWNGSTWVQKGASINGEASNDYCGGSVSMADSNTVAIGAINNDGNGANSGHVRIYNWNGSVWVQKGTDIDGEAAGDLSGWSVAMRDNNTVAIGGVNNDQNGNNSGHVRIYRWNGSAWVQKGIDIDGEAATDVLGWSVTLPDSNVVGVAALLNDGNGTDAGRTSVFNFCSDNSSNVSLTACDSLISPSTKYVWTTNGTYMDTILNSGGCDSVMTINLTINTVDVSVTNSSPMLTANATGASYQWLNCDSGYAVISGATSQNFTATANGNYAVEITENNCTDTSACESVTNVGIIENNTTKPFQLFPNPTNHEINLILSQPQTVTLHNALGKQVMSETVNGNATLSVGHLATGIYYLHADKQVKKLVIQ